MKEYKIITGQFAFSYFNKILFMVVNVLLFATLTTYLSKGEYGILSLLFITISLFAGYLDLGLHQYILKDFPGLKAASRQKKFNSIFSFELIVCCVFFIVGLLIVYPLINYFNYQQYWIPVLLSLFIISVTPLYSFLSNLLFARQKISTSQSFSLIHMLWRVLIVVLPFVLGFLSLNYVFGLRFGIVVLSIICLLVYTFRKDKLKIVIPSRSVIRKALLFSFPIIPLTVSMHLIGAADRYIIGIFHGSALVGSYAYFYSLLSFILSFAIFPTALLFTYAAKEFRKNKEKSNFFLNASAKYSLLLLIPGLIGMFVLRNEIVTLISGPKYLSEMYVLFFLLLFPVLEFFSVFYRRAILLRNKTKYLAFCYILTGVFNIVANVILIPKYHMIGAAIATIISYILLVWLLFRKAKRYVSWNNEYIKVDRILMSALVMGAVLYFFHPTEIVSKIITIIFGAGIYFVCLFITHTFVDQELDLIKSIIRGMPIKQVLGFSSKIFKRK